MLQSTSDFYILFVPLLLLGIGIGLSVLWWKFRYLVSIFWLALSLVCNGSALLIQSLLPIENLVYHHYYLAVLYLTTYIALTQAILSFFNYQVSIRFCLVVLLGVEMSCLYFSFIYDSIYARMLSVALGTSLILLHRFPYILRLSHHGWYVRSLHIVFSFTLLIFVFRSIGLATFIYKAEYNPMNFGSISHWFISQLAILSFTLLFVALLLILNFRKILDAQQPNLQHIRTQQHIQFSHDLHDIVGSTLVRSISQLTHNTHSMNNQQFLLLFEQLKTDLSKVTTHESIDTPFEAVLSPTQWSLPIRERFEVIFLELGISPIWQLSENWLIQPSNEELLTLQRVIEELFTNIIKHSRAKKVRIHLYHSSIYQFILDIEDDGIGFDPEFVFKHSHGIGLRSIKHRLQIINTEMHIFSKKGKTVFQILKRKSL